MTAVWRARAPFQFLLVSALSLFLAALSAASFIVVRDAERDQLMTRALQAAFALENALKAARPHGPGEAQAVLSEFEAEGVRYAALIGQGGRVLAHTDPAQHDRVIADPRVERAFDTDEMQAAFVSGPEGETFDVLLPVKRLPGGKRFCERGPGCLGLGLHPREIVVRMGVVPQSSWLRDWAMAQAAASLAVIVAMWAAFIWARRSAAALARAEGAARRREVLASLGEVSAVLAHEVRNPLAAVKGHLQLGLESDCPDPVRQRVNTALAEVERIEFLVRGLLDYARDKPTSRGPCDLRDVVERAVALATAAGDGAAKRLESNLEPAPVAVDFEQLSRAISNVVRNAIEAVPEGGTVRVACVSRDGRALILVEDSGPGIAAGVAARIFDPFVTGKVRGVGLGLAVARQIVEAHGGAISAGHSDALGGACFRIEVPAT